MKFRFGIASMFQATAIVALLLAALVRYQAAAIELRSLIAGVLMLTVGAVVGGICSTQRATRFGVIAVSLVIYLALINGIIRPYGADHVRWAYACATTGLLLGAIYRLGASDLHPIVDNSTDEGT